MELILEREPAAQGAVLGKLLIPGRLPLESLENEAYLIPAGRYPLALTCSNRLGSRFGYWLLPLLGGVPGHQGIRIHPANWARELRGCIAPGKSRGPACVLESRAAMRIFLDTVAQVSGSAPDRSLIYALKEPTFLTIRAATPPPDPDSEIGVC